MLLSTGVGRFAPRALGTAAVDCWTSRGLEHTVADPAKFTGKDCVVVGGGDSALDWAAELREAGAHVTLIHRRDQFRATESFVVRAQGAGVRIRRLGVLEALRSADRPERAVVRDLRTDALEELPCTDVVLALGFAADLSLLRDWGLPLDGRGVVVTPNTMAVAPGIYAAGDVAAYPGKLKLIATAFAEAALAVSACKLALEPSARLQAGHSSELGSTMGAWLRAGPTIRPDAHRPKPPTSAYDLGVSQMRTHARPGRAGWRMSQSQRLRCSTVVGWYAGGMTSLRS